MLCAAEVPRLVEVQEQHRDEGLVVLGLTAASPDEARGFVAEHDVRYPVLAGDDALLDAWGVDVLWGSEIWLVDPGGVVVARGIDAAERHLTAAD